MDTSDSIKKLLSAFSLKLGDEEFGLSVLQSLIAAEITGRRIEKGMTQKEFADLLGVSQSTLSKWESGETNFTLSTLVSISCKLGIELQSPFVPAAPKTYQTVFDNVVVFPASLHWSNSASSDPPSYSQLSPDGKNILLEM